MNFAGRFADLFRTRGDSGERHAKTYLQGLLSNEPAKNMERIAEVIEGTSWQNLQQFISDSKWDEREVWDRTAQCANARLGGHRDSMLLIDESGEDYLYPANRFVIVTLPEGERERLPAVFEADAA